MQIVLVNFLYAVCGSVLALALFGGGLWFVQRLLGVNFSEQLVKGNPAMGTALAGLFVGLALLVGLVVGMALN